MIYNIFYVVNFSLVNSFVQVLLKKNDIIYLTVNWKILILQTRLCIAGMIPG